MRSIKEGQVLKVRAIAGTYVVVLAWDFMPGQDAARDGLMGFAIERAELEGNTVVERYWMRGIKRFREKDRGLAPGTPVSSADHPVQSFLWADYTAQTGKTYRYKVVPVYGETKLLELRSGHATSVRIATEKEYLLDPQQPNDKARHDVYFNRGVIGSQAYARRFDNRKPDRDNPRAEEMVWLSRGLFEALTGFIGLAQDGYSLRAAFYEFHYLPVAVELAKAHDRGALVEIVYDAESSYKAENEAVIAHSGLAERNCAFPRRTSTGIRHNKFMILFKGDDPVAVWTGSTNISDGGIFGHSNVGHIVWDRTVARAYYEYWKLLKADTAIGDLRGPARALSPLPAGKPGKGTIPLFSPRDGTQELTSLQWYADRMNEAKKVVCITLAFNLDKLFSDVIAQDNDVLRFIVKDDDLAADESIGIDRDVLFAAGGKLDAGALANFAQESGNPLNSNDYIHDKFMLVDPLDDDPLVITGSANFSRPSQRNNDENMLVIRGDTRVADIYFGEFMRIFDHHYARYLVAKLKAAGKADPDAGYLKTRTDEWLPPHLIPDGYKAKRRRYMLGD